MLTTESIPSLSSPHRIPKEKMSSKSPINGDIFIIKTDLFPSKFLPPRLLCWGGGGGFTLTGALSLPFLYEFEIFNLLRFPVMSFVRKNLILALLGISSNKRVHLIFEELRIFVTLMEWNWKQSHDFSDYHIGIARFSSRASQNKTRDTAYIHVIRNGGDRCCVRSNAHCIECHLACVAGVLFHWRFWGNPPFI